MLSITPGINIPMAEFDFSFSRSGGPGGQNVNKVSSKALLRWAVSTTNSLPYDVRARFLAAYAGRITSDGEIIIASQEYRDRASNIDACLEKLRQMVLSVAARPKVRRPTRPTLGSKERRATGKRENSLKKQQRRPPKLAD